MASTHVFGFVHSGSFEYVIQAAKVTSRAGRLRKCKTHVVRRSGVEANAKTKTRQKFRKVSCDSPDSISPFGFVQLLTDSRLLPHPPFLVYTTTMAAPNNTADVAPNGTNGTNGTNGANGHHKTVLPFPT
jgi:hypothetical protein